MSPKKAPSFGSRVYWFGFWRAIPLWWWDHCTDDGKHYWRNA